LRLNLTYNRGRFGLGFAAYSGSWFEPRFRLRTIALDPEASNEETPKERLKNDERSARSASSAAEMGQLQHQTLSFGDFTLDLTRGCLLRRGGEKVKLRPKSFEVLKYLVENGGRLVSKEELIGAVWAETAVTDDSLVQCLIEVRRALGEHGQHFIKTEPRRGYVFETEVVKHDPAGREMAHVEAVHLTIEEEIQEEQTARRGEGVPVRQTASAKSFQSAIRWRKLALAGLGAALALGAFVLYRQRTRPVESQTSAPVRSVAVLPLKNLTGDPANEYFSDGVTENLINALSKIEGLKVISGGSVFSFKERDVDPREVGRQLGVASVLEGSVRKGGDSVRVAVRLVSAADGRVLWTSDTQDRALGDIFALQDEIARRVVAGLRLTLGHESEQRLAKRYTDNVEAYQAYWKGRFFWNKRNKEGLGKAITYFQQAIEIDPDYALAYAGLADSYILKQVYILLEPDETLQQMEAKAKAAAEKALDIDDTLAEAHASLGLIKAASANDEAGIEREYQRAIELNPNYATAHHWYALHLSDLRRFDEAIAEIRRAREIDPRSLVINSDVGIIFSSARQYDQAIEHFKKALEMDQNFPDAHAMLGWTYVRKGMYSEGIAEFEKARALFGSPTSQLDGLIYAYAMSGNRSEALRLLGELKRLTKQQQTQLPWENWVHIHIGLGENDKAFEILEKAYRDGFRVKRYLDTPYADPLRADPRFTDLARRVGLPQ